MYYGTDGKRSVFIDNNKKKKTLGRSVSVLGFFIMTVQFC